MLSGIDSYSNYYSNYLQNQGLSRSDPSETFDATDTDSSGGLSQTELADWLDAVTGASGAGIDTSDALATYDADGDGELNEEELQTFMKDTMPPPPGMMGMGHGDSAEGLFQAMDSDESSGVSESELSQWAGAMSQETGDSIDTSGAFSEYDINEDEELSSEELDAFLAANSLAGPYSPGADEETVEDTSNGTASSGSAGSVLSEYDTNEDGVVSSEELQAYLDDVEANSSQTRMREAISNYSMNFGDSIFNNPQEMFSNMAGAGAGAYTAINIPA